MTRKGSLMPKVLLDSEGQVMKLVETFVPMISSTLDWMSGSVIRLMWPFLTCLSQICKGFALVRVRGRLGGASKGALRGAKGLKTYPIE